MRALSINNFFKEINKWDISPLCLRHDQGLNLNIDKDKSGPEPQKMLIGVSTSFYNKILKKNG